MDPRMQTTITSRSASSSFLPTFILLHVLNRHLIKVHTVITFEAGQSELEFEMEIVDDDEWEPDEEFYVKVMMIMIMMRWSWSWWPSWSSLSPHQHYRSAWTPSMTTRTWRLGRRTQWRLLFSMMTIQAKKRQRQKQHGDYYSQWWRSRQRQF